MSTPATSTSPGRVQLGKDAVPTGSAGAGETSVVHVHSSSCLKHGFVLRIEVVEAAVGVGLVRYALRPDSGGTGRWRGSCGLELEFEALQDGDLLARGLERLRFRPGGYDGGSASVPAELIINEGRTDERRLSVVDVEPLHCGDHVTLGTSGAGGYGHPYDREHTEVLADVRAGLVGVDQARTVYGVHVAKGAVDAIATARIRANRPDSQWGVGPERRRWDRAFKSSQLDRLAVMLQTLPAPVRAERRREVLAQVLDTIPSGFPVTPSDAIATRRAAATLDKLLDKFVRS
jgi:N-methylhydantoinase B